MKRLSVLLVLLLCAAVSKAAPVGIGEAEKVASHFWNVVSSEQIAELKEVRQTGFAEFFVFDVNQGNGFVIVAADDAAYPILGYSTNTPAGVMGGEVRFWLGQYAAEIEALASGNVPVDEKTKSYIDNEWRQMLEGSWQPSKTAAAVPQLMSTQWNQSPYYNALCPTGTPAGCTAIAAAQIMKYWNYPAVGTGSHTYYSGDYGYLSARFDTTSYDWQNMPTRLTSTSTAVQCTAVATLCYHVGVAVEMNYSPSGSGAYVIGGSASAQSALVDYFDYDGSTLAGVYKSGYSDAGWVALLKNELDAGRPILYAGYDSDAGHAFVFDGYNTNGQFHVNWGWGGSYDGYFSMGALNPGGGGVGSNSSNTFNQGNQALIGIQPKPMLAFSAQPLMFDAAGGTAVTAILSNHDDAAAWHVATDASWLAITPTTGAGSGAATTVQVTADSILDGRSRSAVIRVVQGTDTVFASVYQHACLSGQMCSLTVNMTDRVGDGWEGGYLSFRSPSGVLYGTATLRAGSYGSQSVAVCPDTVVVSWNGGSNDAQCGYFIENGDGVMWAHHEAGVGFVLPDTIVAPCAGTGGSPTFTYRLQVSPNDTAWGVVMGADSNVHFGEYRTIQAVAKPGYRFVRWSDNVSTNPRDVVMVRDRSFTARFASLGEDTVQYDNNRYNAAMGGEEDFLWGIKVDTALLVGRPEVSGIKIYCSARGIYNVYVYQNEGDTPTERVYEQEFTLSGSSVGDWCQVVFSSPVRIDHSKSLWIVISSPNMQAPAAMSYWCGNEDGGWVSEDGGSTWTTLARQEEPIYGTWMLRAIVPIDPTEYVLTVTTTRPTWGSVTGGGIYRYGARPIIRAYPTEGHHFVRWSDGGVENPRQVTVTGNATLRATFGEDAVGIGGIDTAGIVMETNGRVLNVHGAVGLAVRVCDVMGRNIYVSSDYDGHPIALPSEGVYMVCVERMAVRRIVVCGE